MTIRFARLLLALPLLVFMTQISDGADGSKSTRLATSAPKKTALSVATPTAATLPRPAALSAAAAPNAGEQIKWQVLSGGGSKGSSTSYVLTGTVGQTAVGPGSSTSYKTNQGFWQNFSSSCCVGTRGNVNTLGIVDLSDLSSLVNYLTGGGYVLPCYDAANVNGLGIVDLSDLSSLVNYLTGGGFVLPACP